MDLGKALENLKFDVRMRDWNTKQKTLTKDEVETHTKDLKDLKDDCEEVTLEDKGDF
jgi:hypothetical protein